MMDEVSYLGSSAQLLKFRNTGHTYPVNEYQSLVLAAASEIAALGMAVRERGTLQSLSAWEICCGGGPAAIALKALGVGYVQATDVNSAAVQACAANAALNKIELQRTVVANLLEDGTAKTFDLICCNPPCGVRPTLGETPDHRPRESVDGGDDGMDVTLDLLGAAPGRLSATGSLILLVVSTGNVGKLQAALNDLFPSRWRVVSPTPVAAPWRRIGDPQVQSIEEISDFQPFVWRRSDGWLWRLTWVVEASMNAAGPWRAHPEDRLRFPLRPFGFEVAHDDGLTSAIEQAGRDAFWFLP